MGKRIVILMLVFSLAFFCTYADSVRPTTEDMVRAFTMVSDCLSAGIVTQYSEIIANPPSCSVSIDPETRLPARVSFFMTDPAVTASIIGQKLGLSNNLFASVFSFLTKTVDDPLLSSVYFSLAKRNYEVSDYLVNGAIGISYPEGLSLETAEKDPQNFFQYLNGITFSVNLTILGKQMPYDMTVKGDFVVVTEETGIVVKSVSVYSINEYYYSNAVFRF